MDDQTPDRANNARSAMKGSNQSGLRDHNERLVLTMIQSHGAMPGVDIARQTGLSQQTVSVILRSLESDHLVVRGDPVRGKVGKPSVPVSLNPDGAFSVGVKIGRRSADVVLIDILGNVRHQWHLNYRYPMPDPILMFLKGSLAKMPEHIGAVGVARIAGIGVAMPGEIWNWHDTIGAPPADLDRWRDLDFCAAIAEFSDLPVQVGNDATAACRAENIYGRGREFSNYAYFFMGLFIGGGVVLNHSVFEGPKGNAGAFGPLLSFDETGKRSQLLDSASLHVLEADLVRAGVDPLRLWTQPQDWSDFDNLVSVWIERTAAHLAQAALTACAVIDFEAVLIDGGFPADVRDRLVASMREKIVKLDQRGLIMPRIEAGSVGGNARGLGAATGPIFSRYFLNTHGAFAAV